MIKNILCALTMTLMVVGCNKSQSDTDKSSEDFQQGKPLTSPKEIVTEQPPAPNVLATIANIAITKEQVQNGVTQYQKGIKNFIRQDLSVDKVEELPALVLDQLINVQAVLLAAKKEGITITPLEIDAQLALMDKNPHTSAMLKELHINRQELKIKLRNELIVRKFMESKFERDIAITEKEIQQFYTQKKKLFVQPAKVRASHIYSKTDRAKIASLIPQLKQGAAFKNLAKKYSEDASTAAKGGDLGFFAKGDLLPEFDKTAFVMSIGQVSQVIKTSIGYHILTITDKQGDAPLALKEVTTDIKKLLIMQKNNTRMEKIIRDIRKKTDVKIYR